jgi:hypothetical protein
MVCLTSLPSHILVDITAYLDNRTLKYLSPLHSILKEVCDIHLFHKISLPLSNPYLRSVPIKPYLASALEGHGWEDNAQQSNHLDASLRFLIPLLKGREGYVRELSIDLKSQYHDPELDYNNLTNPTNLLNPPCTVTTPDDKYQDLPSELDQLRIKASLIRQSESPTYLPHLADTFSSFPILPAIRSMKLTIYESFTGYLPYLFYLVPNITELILEPHDLLVESPLCIPDVQCSLPRLRKLRVEPMLDSLRPFVRDLMKVGAIEELILGGGRWTMDRELAGAIRDCEGLKRLEVGKKARRILLASQNVLDEPILVGDSDRGTNTYLCRRSERR